MRYFHSKLIYLRVNEFQIVSRDCLIENIYAFRKRKGTKKKKKKRSNLGHNTVSKSRLKLPLRSFDDLDDRYREF